MIAAEEKVPWAGDRDSAVVHWVWPSPSTAHGSSATGGCLGLVVRLGGASHPGIPHKGGSGPVRAEDGGVSIAHGKSRQLPP